MLVSRECSPQYPSGFRQYVFNDGVGTFLTQPLQSETLMIWSVSIAQSERGKGYGKQMMQELVELLGHYTLRLSVFKTNVIALHIYLSVGFRVVSDDACLGRTMYEMERTASVARFTQSGTQKEV